MATQTTTSGPILDELVKLMRFDEPSSSTHAVIISDKLSKVEDAGVSAEDRFRASVAALLLNVQPVGSALGGASETRFEKGNVQDVIASIDQLVNAQINEIIHAPEFQELESAWTGVADLVEHTNFKAGVEIDLFDVTKGELAQDFENNSSNVFGGEFFRKAYIEEYDQYGGKPYGALIGLYDFANTSKDIFWLKNMAKVANAAHAPFVAAASYKFFGGETVGEVEAVKDLEGLLAQPKFNAWNHFRDSAEAAYVGLTFPRYVLRLPWSPEKNPTEINFTEIAGGEAANYVWGNAAILFARNLVRSYEQSGWCQYLRGPKGGGLITGLPVDTFFRNGEQSIQPPVEIAIPDYRELEFAKSGFIPLIHRKGSGDAAFFSTQAAKRTQKFKDPKDSENSQLVANLCYTFSVTRIAHYVKCIMRDNIGTTADDKYIQGVLSSWLNQYVTQVTNPDDLTVRRFPFKASEVVVTPRPGEIGWYDCSIAVLPHLQFEGMNVELRLESRLGAAEGGGEESGGEEGGGEEAAEGGGEEAAA